MLPLLVVLFLASPIVAIWALVRAQRMTGRWKRLLSWSGWATLALLLAIPLVFGANLLYQTFYCWGADCPTAIPMFDAAGRIVLRSAQAAGIACLIVLIASFFRKA